MLKSDWSEMLDSDWSKSLISDWLITLNRIKRTVLKIGKIEKKINKKLEKSGESNEKLKSWQQMQAVMEKQATRAATTGRTASIDMIQMPNPNPKNDSLFIMKTTCNMIPYPKPTVI